MYTKLCVGLLPGSQSHQLSVEMPSCGAVTLQKKCSCPHNTIIRTRPYCGSCSKFILYTLIALGCAIQLAFGVYVLIMIGMVYLSFVSEQF